MTHHGQVLLLRQDSRVVGGADGGGVGGRRGRRHVPQARLERLHLELGLPIKTVRLSILSHNIR